LDANVKKNKENLKMNKEANVGKKLTPADYEMQKQARKQKFVRNEFDTVGYYDMPLIKNQDIDLDTIELFDFRKTAKDDKENDYKSIHFFCHDWHFDNVYENPKDAIENLGQYYALLTPDFSLYEDMPLTLQMYSTFKNRWCGAFWQEQGFNVIPTIGWSDERSWVFCFDGIEQGSVVAVSTYCREDNKDGFMNGYNKMLEIIKPKGIICYGDKFPEMNGNIKVCPAINHKELIRKLGQEKYVNKYLSGELYPS
jgi:hypothetical protein